MIKLTRLNGLEVIVNEDNIQWIEELADTTVTFVNGVRLIVKESAEEILQKMNQEATPQASN